MRSYASLSAMQIKPHCQHCHKPKPESFAALMELYETNYLLLRLLCPNFSELAEYEVSSLACGMSLHLQIMERSPYTTTLMLTYRFENQGDITLRPELVVRLYRDAQQAEAMSRRCRLEEQFSTDDSVLLCKWRINRFLYKWLRYLLRQGHRFPAAASAQPSLT